MPFRVLIAIDKFKGTFTSIEIAYLIEKKIKRELNCTTHIIPVCDGGQGFLESIFFINNFQKIQISTLNALFEPIETFCLAQNDTCFVESSKVIGIDLLPKSKQNPCKTTSLGLGLMLKQCIDRGYKKIIVGLGGSATNDAGIGMAEALGAVFTDKKGNILLPIGQNLNKIQNIDVHKLKKRIENIQFSAFCDVQNPLFGKQGAAFKYAAQKGANFNQIYTLDTGLQNIYKFSKFPTDTQFQKFFGSAGGLGFGFKFFLNSNLYSGAEKIIEMLQIEKKICECDLLITGEGKFDEQSFNGKITGKLIDLASKYNKKVIVLCGLAEKKIYNDQIKILSLFENRIEIEKIKEQTLHKINNLDITKML